jgi:uncharacterized protein (TIGR03083 family)
VGTVDPARRLESIADDARRIAEAVRAHPEGRVATCPDWSGTDLLAHLCGVARQVVGLCTGRAERGTPALTVPPDEADRAYDADLAHLIATLRDTPPEAAAPNWSVAAQTASFWQRRMVHEFAVHRWDADTLRAQEPDPVPVDVADDGISEFFDVVVATAFARGLAPPAHATLVLEATDTGVRREQHLPGPGPVTTLRGTTSDLLLALWRRRDPLAHHVDGPRGPLEQWPSI